MLIFDVFGVSDDRKVGSDVFGTLPITVTDTEISGGLQRNMLSSAYSFQNSILDPASTNVHYDGTSANSARASASKIIYKLRNPFDITTNSFFKMNFSQLRRGLAPRIVLTSGTSAKRTSLGFLILPESLNNGIDLMREGKFVDSGGEAFDPTQVTGFRFVINGEFTPRLATSTMYGVIADIDSFEVLPEPFSMMTLGAGVAGLVKKKKK